VDETFLPGHTETMPRGRVPLDPADVRAVTIKVRLTEREAERVRWAAETAGVSVSELARRALLPS